MKKHTIPLTLSTHSLSQLSQHCLIVTRNRIVVVDITIYERTGWCDVHINREYLYTQYFSPSRSTSVNQNEWMMLITSLN